MALEESPEHVVMEHMRPVNPADPSTFVVDTDSFSTFTQDAATVVIASRCDFASVVVWHLEPGQENDFHYHPDNEHIQYVIEGECEWTLGESAPVTLRPGQLVIVPKGTPHGIRNTSDAPARYVALTSTGAPIEKILVERPGE